MNIKYSVLINTCDKFEDCWNPFFKLWSTYWKDCNATIYLNTEYKDYNYPGLDIHSVKGCVQNNIPRDKRATWSQCLKWALETMDTDIILYLQEDYFLKDNVKNDIVENYVDLMLANNDISCIHLTDQAVILGEKASYEGLYTVVKKQRYRVSCQAALWRKEELLKLLRDYEDAWEFEEFGSMRSAIINSNYYAVSKEVVKINEFEIIPYVFTGIVQGRWYEEVVPLFNKHEINVDYQKRGFLQNAPAKPLFKRLKYRFNKIFKIIKNNKELKKLRSNH